MLLMVRLLFRSPLLKLRWKLANVLVFDKIKKTLGGRIRFAITGGAALDAEIQQFFEDMGVPILGVRPHLLCMYIS